MMYCATRSFFAARWINIVSALALVLGTAVTLAGARAEAQSCTTQASGAIVLSPDHPSRSPKRWPLNRPPARRDVPIRPQRAGKASGRQNGSAKLELTPFSLTTSELPEVLTVMVLFVVPPLYLLFKRNKPAASAA